MSATATNLSPSSISKRAPTRLVVAITGATGVRYGVRLLEILRTIDSVESHLLVSAAGWLTLRHELGLDKPAVRQLADVVHSVRDVGATLASGSFITHGMVIAPCSMKTLSSIAQGFSDNLITRAAEVTLKERRRLILLVRETPLNLVHLRNMTTITEMGGIIFPPLPAFYNHPTSIDDIVDHTVERVLDLFGLHSAEHPTLRWAGLSPNI